MKLRAFDVDLHDAEKEARHRFGLETRYVSAMFERLFPGLETKGIWKVLVECVPDASDDRVRNLLGAATVRVRFDLDAYHRASVEVRKAMALDALFRGCVRVATDQHWPKEPFSAARDAVLQEGPANKWRSDKSKASPDRAHRATLEFDQGPESFKAWIVVTDRSGREIQRQLVVEDPPSEFMFASKIGALEWASSDSVVLKDKKGRPQALLRLSTTRATAAKEASNRRKRE